MKGHVEQIKERLNIADIIGAYVKLEKAGANFKAKCPFHNEKTASFYITPDRGTYYCFGCGEKGDIFTFIEKFEGLDFKGALKVLADKAGVTLTPMEYEKKDDTEKLYAIMEEATVFFEKELENNPDAKAYILGRGLTAKTLKDMRIGYARDEWRSLLTHLRTKGFKDKDIFSVGLIKRTEKVTEEPYYDVFRGRITFPISDSSGRVVAFSGRIIKDDPNAPKYLNSPETVLFSKSKVLYGLDKAKVSIRKSDYAILVEGQMDCVFSHQAGFTNTIAVSGTAFSDEAETNAKVTAIGLITRLSKNVIVAFDSDDAGYKATVRVARQALGLGMDVKVALITGGKDPADIIKLNPKDWLVIIKNAKPIVAFLLETILAKGIDGKKLSQKIRDEVLPYVALYESSIEKGRQIEYIVGKTGLKSDTLWEDMKRLSVNNNSTQVSIPRKGHEVSRLEELESQAFGLLLRFKDAPYTVPFDETKLKSIVGEARSTWFKLLPPIDTSALITKAEVLYGDPIDMKKVHELILSLEFEYLKKKRDEIGIELRKVDKGKTKDGTDELMKEHQSISRKIDEIDIQLKK